MKFKFCSEGDCPLWALAALHALGSLPAALFRTLLQHVMEEQPDDGIMEILKDTSLSSREECARAAAVIRWVVSQACACACPGAQLTRDLLVLGVPRAHAAALADAVDNYRPEHVANVEANGFMINKLTDVSLTPGPEGTVDTYTLTMHTDDVFTGEQKKQDLLIERSQAKTLLEELKRVYKKMEEIQTDFPCKRFVVWYNIILRLLTRLPSVVTMANTLPREEAHVQQWTLYGLTMIPALLEMM